MRPLVSLAVLLLAPAASAAAECTPTGYVRDGIDLTAALVNPPEVVSGVLDATGCHIGVYFGPGATGVVDAAEISGATYFGVVGDAGFSAISLTVRNSWIYRIGESPFNGAQHGVGIYVAAYEPGSSAGVLIEGNTVERYQKSGIVANGMGVSAEILDNVVIGLGPVGFIAQNGIQVGFGAAATVARNRVEGNSCTAMSAVSGGILVVGGPWYGAGMPYTTNTRIVGNTVLESDIGIFLTNLDEYGLQPQVATNIKAISNTISKTGLTNNYAGIGYQAGISDAGNNDKLIDNMVAGSGYDPAAFPLAYIVALDADPSFTARPKAQANRN